MTTRVSLSQAKNFWKLTTLMLGWKMLGWKNVFSSKLIHLLTLSFPDHQIYQYIKWIFKKGWFLVLFDKIFRKPTSVAYFHSFLVKELDFQFRISEFYHSWKLPDWYSEFQIISGSFLEWWNFQILHWKLDSLTKNKWKNTLYVKIR